MVRSIMKSQFRKTHTKQIQRQQFNSSFQFCGVMEKRKKRQKRKNCGVRKKKERTEFLSHKTRHFPRGVAQIIRIQSSAHCNTLTSVCRTAAIRKISNYILPPELSFSRWLYLFAANYFTRLVHRRNVQFSGPYVARSAHSNTQIN